MMAEICCGVVSGSETSAETCEPSSRAARKRRMELRRFRFVSSVASPTEVLCSKRQRLVCFRTAAAMPAALPLDFNTGVEESRTEGSASVGNDSSSTSNLSSDPSPSPSPAGEVVVSGQCPRYGVTSVCGRRRDMEDAVSVKPTFLRRGGETPASYHFFGVYDGHGCSHVAMSCKDRMHEVMAEELESHGSDPPNVAEWKALMERSFSRMDTEVLAWCSGAHRNANCRCELQTPKCEHVGSTAMVAVVAPEQIVVANCGDSRAVLCRKGVPVPLSTDHKPDRPDELQRIQEAGGRVIYWDGARVLGVLAMSRAIGDSYLKPYVISEPEVTVTERTEEDECLILASDGLWDVVSNGTACDIVRMCLRGNAQRSSRSSPCPGGGAAEEGEGEGEGGGSSDKACSDAAVLLTKLALARHSSDNVSVVVIDLRKNS